MPDALTMRYQELAERVLGQGHLGYGRTEDWLMQSGRWLHHPLVPGGGSFADYFRAALDHHVALLCAVNLDPEDAACARDFDEFLRIVLDWILDVPLELLLKSREPLGLVVSGRQSGQAFGSQVMRCGGPSLIFWEVFRSLRRSLRLEDYSRLGEQIGQTLVHEMIGHQLAFCAESGSCLSRDDLRDVLSAAGIDELKLIGRTMVNVDTFLDTDDLLASLQLVEYVVSPRNIGKYFGNVVELIAFAVEGSRPDSHQPYDDVLAVLKRSLLRLSKPISVGDDGSALYRGFSFESRRFEEYFIEHRDGKWRETRAARLDGRWLSLSRIVSAAADRRTQLESVEAIEVAPQQRFMLNLSGSSYLLQLDDHVALATPFGIAAGDSLEAVPALAFNKCGAAVRAEPSGSPLIRHYTVTNDADRPVTLRIVRLDM
ncbi:MAG: hypothetical protein JNG89_19565 [Planctomycetaceae bacterium]|nr:hypothetical protein [Planctomycetaceae bacterium]